MMEEEKQPFLRSSRTSLRPLRLIISGFNRKER